jgi:hypothetical protein
MAIQRRVNWISQQRANVDDMRAIESAGSNDWDQSTQAIWTNSIAAGGIGYVIRGFEILMASAIGGAASALQVQVDPGALLHIASSQSGTVYMVPPGTVNQQLNGATNTNVVGAFVPNSFNYVGVDYTRFLDTTTDSQVYLWDPTSNTETTTIAPRANILTYELIITTSTWASNVLPVAIVETDAGNNVLSITDSRWLLCRLGQGGASPNPFYVYPWTAQSEGRTENPSTSTSNSVNPFEGGDKMLFSMKDWMNAIMSSLLEIKGTNYWYSSISSTGSLTNLREDLGLTVVTGNTTISTGILPNTTPVLSTTGNTNSTNQLTNLASTTGIAPGQVVMGSGIPTNTTVLSILGTTVTMSAASGTTLTGTAVSFYQPSQVTAPGQVNWASNPPGSGQIYFKLIGSQLSYEIVENPTGSSVTLSDNQVAYITLTRNAAIAPNLTFTNGSPTVNSVGSVTWTTSLQAGDWIKQATDSDAGYYQILTVNSPSQVTLTENFAETTSPSGGVVAQYAYGTYTLPGETSTSRDMVIAYRYDVPLNGNVVWLFLCSYDGGSVPRVYIKFMGAEIQNGDAIELSGPTLNNVLQYIGSPTESAIAPQYTATVFSSPVPEITQVTVSAASAMASNQFFLIYSSGAYRKYYVWANIDGTGVDPAPYADYMGVEWVISSSDTAAQVATDLVNALNALSPNDFLANSSGAVVTVTNNSAGTTTAASNITSAPVGGLSITVTQVGTGIGNAVINDGDNLTLAIKKLDDEFGGFIEGLDSPTYDETLLIVASGGSSPPYYGSGYPDFSPVSINGPISASTDITLPGNTRLGNIPQKYTVGKGSLEVYLNGQYLELGIDWLEVGYQDEASEQIQILQNLVVGDYLEFRIGAGSGGGGGGGGVGPPGPAGPQGPAGEDAAGGPVSITTKTSSYVVSYGDCFLRADCTSSAITFTLPDATNISSIGRIFYLKKVDSTTNAMVIQAFGAQLIDGANVQTSIVQYESFSIVSNGVSWDVF